MDSIFSWTPVLRPLLFRHRHNTALNKEFTLEATNNTTITAFALLPIAPYFQRRRHCRQMFIKASVRTPIIGVDFLSPFGTGQPITCQEKENFSPPF